MAPFFFFLLTAFSAHFAAAQSTYDCTLEYGETVPLALLVLKKEAPCLGCEEAGVEIPTDSLDATRSKFWNESVRQNPLLSTKIKRHGLAPDAFLETRYATQKGEPFSLKVHCPKEGEKCQGSLGEPTLTRQTKLSNQRVPGAEGKVWLQLTSRDHLNLLSRLERASSSGVVSSSGELKIFREDPLFIFDVGVDERLALLPGIEPRLAAFEVKIRCEKEKAAPVNKR
jgi:hypothetical protein